MQLWSSLLPLLQRKAVLGTYSNPSSNRVICLPDRLIGIHVVVIQVSRQGFKKGINNVQTNKLNVKMEILIGNINFPGVLFIE